MSASIIGFVGFTQQESDILDPREAATITEYLRSMFESGALGIKTLSADLSAHIADYNDPHRTARSVTFITSVYGLLYKYYCDISDETPMGYTAFYEMMQSPILFELVRRILLNKTMFAATTSNQQVITFPNTVDRMYADPNAVAQPSTLTLYPDIERFFKALGGVTGWDTFAKGNALGMAANFVAPVFYARMGLPPIVTKTQWRSDFYSLTDLVIPEVDFPITMALRLGSGSVSTTDPVDILSFSFDQGNYILQWNPSTTTLSLVASNQPTQTLLSISAPTGTTWLEITPTGMIVASLSGQTYNRQTYDIPKGTTLSNFGSFSILQPLTGVPQKVSIFALTLFSGVMDSDLTRLQSLYL